MMDSMSYLEGSEVMAGDTCSSLQRWCGKEEKEEAGSEGFAVTFSRTGTAELSGGRIGFLRRAVALQGIQLGNNAYVMGQTNTTSPLTCCSACQITPTLTLQDI
jgi:hypothetical protein